LSIGIIITKLAFLYKQIGENSFLQFYVQRGPWLKSFLQVKYLDFSEEWVLFQNWAMLEKVFTFHTESSVWAIQSAPSRPNPLLLRLIRSILLQKLHYEQEIFKLKQAYCTLRHP